MGGGNAKKITPVFFGGGTRHPPHLKRVGNQFFEIIFDKKSKYANLCTGTKFFVSWFEAVEIIIWTSANLLGTSCESVWTYFTLTENLSQKILLTSECLLLTDHKNKHFEIFRSKTQLF
jgi:hypothetical protein